jgi:hypothetical protein
LAHDFAPILAPIAHGALDKSNLLDPPDASFSCTTQVCPRHGHFLGAFAVCVFAVCVLAVCVFAVILLCLLLVFHTFSLNWRMAHDFAPMAHGALDKNNLFDLPDASFSCTTTQICPRRGHFLGAFAVCVFAVCVFAVCLLCVCCVFIAVYLLCVCCVFAVCLLLCVCCVFAVCLLCVYCCVFIAVCLLCVCCVFAVYLLCICCVFAVCLPCLLCYLLLVVHTFSLNWSMILPQYLHQLRMAHLIL